MALTRSEFRKHAVDVPVTIDGKQHTAVVKEFSTGSLGWNINGKQEIQLNGKSVRVQIGLNLTIVNSKEFKESEDSPSQPPAAAA